jgi:FOG: Ankyrin repeat
MGAVFFLLFVFIVLILAQLLIHGVSILLFGFYLGKGGKKKRDISLKTFSIFTKTIGILILIIPVAIIARFAIERVSENIRENTLAGAAEYGYYEKAHELLQKGADPDKKSSEKLTPLMYAASRGDYDIAKLLIEYGADVNAEHPGSPEPSVKGFTPLIYAMSNRTTAVLQLLLDNGADINHKSENGTSALIRACTYDRRDLMKTLIENGADINAVDDEGKSALYYAIDNIVMFSYDELDTVDFFLKNGADADVTTNCGETLLELVNQKKEAFWREMGHYTNIQIDCFNENLPRIEAMLSTNLH